MNQSSPQGVRTALTHLAEEEHILGAVTPPLFQNSLFVFERMDDFHGASAISADGPPFVYSRIGNPTLDIVERKIAYLERCDKVKLMGSGMAAISCAIYSCVEQGSHVVMVDTAYGPTREFVSNLLGKLGVTMTLVDGRCTESIFDAARPETTLIYLESPSSIIFRLQDLAEISALAREKGITTVIDNTYSAGVFQKPIELGIDIVVHSGSKYFGGHSDLNAGVICSSQERMDRMIRQEVALFGSVLAPFPAWLMLRSMRTLMIRLKAHQENANAVAAWLATNSKVERVFHVGSPTFEQNALYAKQMTGSCGLLSMMPRFQSREQVRQFVDGLKLFQMGVSWGGFESLAVPIHMQPLGWDEHLWVVRLFCGLEDAADLIADLKQAFDQVD